MKKINNAVRTAKAEEQTVVTMYEEGDYIVVIERTGNLNEAWLGKKGIGVRMFMFGTEDSEETFLKLVEGNLDDYISYFDEDYCEEDIK